jgi:hypothetical protein
VGNYIHIIRDLCYENERRRIQLPRDVSDYVRISYDRNTNSKVSVSYRQSHSIDGFQNIVGAESYTVSIYYYLPLQITTYKIGSKLGKGSLSSNVSSYRKVRKMKKKM